MTDTLERTKPNLEQELRLPEFSIATDPEIIAYLKYSCGIAEVSALAERDAVILHICDRLSIAVSDGELQVAGDAFRQEHKLLGTSETLSWLQQQRITVEDWAQGVRIDLLTKKLKEHLFGESIDSHYLSNRDDYKRVALSQILVHDLTEALQIAREIQEDNASFCAVAIERSKARQSRQSGGFVGIKFMAELMPEIKQAIVEIKEGEVIGPIQTKIGFHILKIEKWYLPELNESTRATIFELLFKMWLSNLMNSSIQTGH